MSSPPLVSLLLVLTFAARATTAAEPATARDRYGGVTALRGQATGWFHVEKLNGRWFFITPAGNAFFSLGVTHADDAARRDERDLFHSRYGGREESLADFLTARLLDWGFNSAGYGALPPMTRRVPYVATIETEGPRSHSAAAKSEFRDIFDPSVQARLRATVREAAKQNAANRFCLGYVLIDLPVWSVQPRTGENYAAFMRALPEDAPGRRAWAAFQRENPEADDEAFIRRLADTYYACVVGELRRADPHHLVLGDRLMATPGVPPMQTPDSVILTAAQYVDVLSFQPMGTQHPIRGFVDRVHKLTGKPVLLADVNTMTMRPARDATNTEVYEREAGEHTLAYYLDAAASSACIGIHRCTFRDYQPWNPRYHRRGLLKIDDTDYSLLVDYTRRTNEQVLRQVYGAAVEFAKFRETQSLAQP